MDDADAGKYRKLRTDLLMHCDSEHVRPDMSHHVIMTEQVFVNVRLAITRANQLAELLHETYGEQEKKRVEDFLKYGEEEEGTEEGEGTEGERSMFQSNTESLKEDITNLKQIFQRLHDEQRKPMNHSRPGTPSIHEKKIEEISDMVRQVSCEIPLFPKGLMQNSPPSLTSGCVAANVIY